MTESEYAILYNWISVSNALSVLSGFHGGEGCGLTHQERIAITKPLGEMQIRLAALVTGDREEG